MPRASAADRAHFASIAEGEALAESERIERALAMTPGDRMRLGAELAAGWLWTPAHLAEADARADGQMELARRRIARGLDGRLPR